MSLSLAQSVVCGTVVAVIGWRKQTRRRGQTVLVATLSVLVANVANLVILQVRPSLFYSHTEVWPRCQDIDGRVRRVVNV